MGMLAVHDLLCARRFLDMRVPGGAARWLARYHRKALIHIGVSAAPDVPPEG
jgi:hypothetical protein